MATKQDSPPEGSSKTFRDLLLTKPGVSPLNENWLRLSEDMAQPRGMSDASDSDARQFLALHPVERRLFYKLFPWRGRALARILIRMGKGKILMGELQLVQNLLRAESAEDLGYTMVCYTAEFEESSSLIRSLLGLRCSARYLSNFVHEFIRKG